MTPVTWISISHFQRASPKGISLLKVHEKQTTTSRILEIDCHNHIYYETTRLRLLGECIFFQRASPKGISLLKVHKKPEIDPHNHIYSETT